MPHIQMQAAETGEDLGGEAGRRSGIWGENYLVDYGAKILMRFFDHVRRTKKAIHATQGLGEHKPCIRRRLPSCLNCGFW